MQRGRKPKPTALKIIQGNPGMRPLNDAEPIPAGDIPKPPKHLCPEAGAKWDEMASQLAACNLLTELDEDALAAYCEQFAIWLEAKDRYRVEGLVVVQGKNGCYLNQNPWLSVANKALDNMNRLGSEFGLTPSARTRIKVSGKASGNSKEAKARALFKKT